MFFPCNRPAFFFIASLFRRHFSVLFSDIARFFRTMFTETYVPKHLHPTLN